jgi:hypothetical protein
MRHCTKRVEGQKWTEGSSRVTANSARGSRRVEGRNSPISASLCPGEVVGCAIEPVKALATSDRAALCLQPGCVNGPAGYNQPKKITQSISIVSQAPPMHIITGESSRGSLEGACCPFRACVLALGWYINWVNLHSREVTCGHLGEKFYLVM